MSKKFDTLHKKAVEGDVQAQFRLAALYYRGNGVNKDDTKAFEWFRRAALKGYSPAQYELGKCYRWGIGVTQNNRLALRFFKRAAAEGNADAENRMGDIYEQGILLKRDYEKAKLWYLRAASHGSISAFITLEIHYGITPPDGVQMPIDYMRWRNLVKLYIGESPENPLDQEKDSKGRTIKNGNISFSLCSPNLVI